MINDQPVALNKTDEFKVVKLWPTLVSHVTIFD